ncbi:MAG: hypothetical protein EB060_08440 [Proteobacteria bacterium]|nr:hypothetical protein [Pseudomonadota bacterium]
MRFSLKKDGVFFLFLAIQCAFWTKAHHVLPNMEVLPPLSSEVTVKASAFGDEQFYFRALGMQIQNAGDSFGRATPLKDYDFKVLRGWFGLLDTLDARSNYMPSMAAYYFSNTQKAEDTRYIVDYLTARGDKDPVKNWWWYAQAVTIAKYKLNDKKLALDIAYKLAAVPDSTIPIWTHQMPAFILADLGETEQAIVIMMNVARDYDNLSQGEQNYINYFIMSNKDKLQKLKDIQKQAEQPRYLTP